MPRGVFASTCLLGDFLLNTERVLGIVLFAVVFFLGLSPLQNDAPQGQGKNPFMLPEGVYPKGESPSVPVEPLTLQAILSVNGQKIATINGRNFVVGDNFGGREIMEIFEDRVVLEVEGVQAVLKLKDPSFPIKIRDQK